MTLHRYYNISFFVIFFFAQYYLFFKLSMKLFFLISIAWSAVIPIELSPISNSISITMSDGVHMRFIPSLSSDSVIGAICDDVRAHQEYMVRMRGSTARFDNSSASFRLQRVRFESIAAERLHGYRPSLGLGPNSDLVEQHNSVDFVRDQNGGRLVLGSSEESFITENCIENSDIRVGLSPRALVIGGERTIFFDGSVDHVFQVTFDDLVAIFGTYRDHFLFNYNRGDSITFANCAESLRTFPHIPLQFFYSGNMFITPEEYTRMIGDDVCELLFFILPRTHQGEFGINPLLLPGINMRTTRDGFLICDAP